MRSIVFSLLLLAGCATPQTPGIKVEYVDKPIIQVQSCVKASDVPERPSRLAAAPSNLETALAVSLAKISEWTRYGNRADVIMKGCSQVK